MRFSSTIFTLLILATADYAIGQAVEPKYDASCSYLSGKIFCFGGATIISPKISDAAMNVLDIIKYSGSTADELKNKWISITTNPNNLDIKSRDAPQMVPLPDGKRMLLSGGWSSGKVKLTSQTLTFNGETNSWEDYAGYTEPPFGVRQIFHAAAAYVPRLGTAYYGGIEHNYNTSWTYPSINLTAYEDAGIVRRYIGYTDLTFFDIRTPSNPWFVYTPQSSKPLFFSNYQTSIYDAKSDRIFFFGGQYLDPPSINYVYYSFSNSLTFDLKTGIWGVQDFKGIGPAYRLGHSSTIVGPKQRHVLIYGGESRTNNNKALLDYCFTLDLDTYQWTQQIISPIEGAVSPILIRTQHSAVPVSNNVLFIVLGRDATNVPTLSMVILNVTDPTHVTLIDKYIDPNAAVASSPDSDSKSPNSNSTSPNSNSTSSNSVSTESSSEQKLSSGAIAGISVGAALIIIAIIVFYLFKKRKAEKHRRKSEGIENQEIPKTQDPVMEVNWDEIENRYSEVPTHFTYAPQLSDDNSIVANSTASPDSMSTMLGKKKLGPQRPHIIDENETYNINIQNALQKPDGI